jgi:DNA-binding response OmpR family regulator
MKLLLIASDNRLAGVLRSWMGLIGTTVHWIVSGGEAEPALRSGQYNCVVLEQSLADMDGDEVLRRIRQSGFDHPLIIIAAADQAQERIRLLDLGADDFVVKPVHLGELAARLRALLRRYGAGSSPEAELRHGRLHVTTASRTAWNNGSRVPLTNKEYGLLETLLRSKGRVLTRQQLEQALHGRSNDAGSNPVEVHVHHLRRKLGTELIRTVRGVGYTLGAEG